MYNNNFMIDRLSKQKEEIDNLIRNYQNMNNQTPVNNFITSSPPLTAQKDLIEWRILNENEEVDNLFVQNKTLFINDNMMILKGVDGKLEKWDIKKIYPIDKKDEKINALEEEIKKLKEIINNEHSKFDEPIRNSEQPVTNVERNVDRKPKANVKSISKQE